MTADELLAAGIVVEPPPPPPERFSVEELFADVETHSGDPPEEGRAPPTTAPIKRPWHPANRLRRITPQTEAGSLETTGQWKRPGSANSSEGSDLLDGVVLEGGETEFQEFLD